MEVKTAFDYLVTEYISGESLDKKLAGGLLSESELISLEIQLAQGLSAAHACGIVHFEKQSLELWDEPWLRERLQRLSEQGYESSVDGK